MSNADKIVGVSNRQDFVYWCLKWPTYKTKHLVLYLLILIPIVLSKTLLEDPSCSRISWCCRVPKYEIFVVFLAIASHDSWAHWNVTSVTCRWYKSVKHPRYLCTPSMSRWSNVLMFLWSFGARRSMKILVSGWKVWQLINGSVMIMFAYQWNICLVFLLLRRKTLHTSKYLHVLWRHCQLQVTITYCISLLANVWNVNYCKESACEKCNVWRCLYPLNIFSDLKNVSTMHGYHSRKTFFFE